MMSRWFSQNPSTGLPEAAFATRLAIYAVSHRSGAPKSSRVPSSLPAPAAAASQGGKCNSFCLLLFIAFFVWIGAAQEAGAAQIQNAIGGIPVRQAMLTDFRTLNRTDPLKRAVELTLAGSQKDFPVVENGAITGILTQTDLIKALTNGDREAAVNSAMQEQFATVNDLDMLETAFESLQTCNCHTVPVTREGKLVGLLTMDNLGEYMRIQAAMRN